MRKRNLLIVPNHSVFRHNDGYFVERAEADLVREVRKACDRVALAAFLQDGTAARGLTGRLGSGDVDYFSLGLFRNHTGPRKVANYAWAFVALPFVLARFRTIYVFAPGPCGVLAAMWSWLLGRRYGFYVRGTWLDDRGETPVWWRLAFARAHFIIATGEAFRLRLSRFCSTVKNEVPLTSIRPETVDPVRPPRASGPKLTLLFVGRLVESKGVLDIVRAIQWLREERGVEISAEFAGGGSSEEVLRLAREIRECNLGDRVRLLGHVEPHHLRDLYKSASVFAFPSYYPEGFPRVLYEAMVFSLPIVTSRMPGLDGFLVDGENCLYSRTKDSRHLGETILRVVEDPHLANRLGTAARRSVEDLFVTFDEKTHGDQLVTLSRLLTKSP